VGHEVTGIEDQCIILYECSPGFELLSRARNQLIFVSTQKSNDDKDKNVNALLSIAQNHEELGYKCPQMSDCPYTGFKLVQKIRFNTKLSEETLDILNGILLEKPSNDFLNEIAQNEDIVSKCEKFDSMFRGKMNINDDNKNLASKMLDNVTTMIGKYPEAELMKMRQFLKEHKSKSKLSIEIINKVLENDEAIENLRIVLDDDWKVHGVEAMNKVDKIIKAEKKKCRTNTCNIA